jgi:hypothetical protein
MKTLVRSAEKKEVFGSLNFSKLNLAEMLKIRGGDGTTGDGDPGGKIPD